MEETGEQAMPPLFEGMPLQEMGSMSMEVVSLSYFQHSACDMRAHARNPNFKESVFLCTHNEVTHFLV